MYVHVYPLCVMPVLHLLQATLTSYMYCLVMCHTRPRCLFQACVRPEARPLLQAHARGEPTLL